MPLNILNEEGILRGFCMENTSHKMSWDGRRLGYITGVKDVVSFDNTEVLLETSMGILTIRGKDLQVKQLSVEKGDLQLEGSVDSLSYSESRQEKNKRMFSRGLK